MTSDLVMLLCNWPEAFVSDLGDDHSRYLYFLCHRCWCYCQDIRALHIPVWLGFLPVMHLCISERNCSCMFSGIHDHYNPLQFKCWWYVLWIEPRFLQEWYIFCNVRSL